MCSLAVTGCDAISAGVALRGLFTSRSSDNWASLYTWFRSFFKVLYHHLHLYNTSFATSPCTLITLVSPTSMCLDPTLGEHRWHTSLVGRQPLLAPTPKQVSRQRSLVRCLLFPLCISDFCIMWTWLNPSLLYNVSSSLFRRSYRVELDDRFSHRT